MAAQIPPVLLPATPSPAQPLRYSLLQAAYGPYDLPQHAGLGGIQYTTSVCGDGYGYQVACVGSLATKTFADGITTVTGLPFVVYSTLVCGAVGFSQDELRQMVVNRLLSVENKVVETLFSSGTFQMAPSLANNTPVATTVVGAGVTSVEVLSELERAGYCTSSYGQPLFIHAPIPVLNDLISNHVLSWDGQRWRTPMGSIVSSGCYANLTPAGAAAATDGTFWMYATGAVNIWRAPESQIFVNPVEGSLDRTTNQQRMLAEREYVLTTECTTYAKAVVLWP